MRVLVACEFSGIVRDAFICAGHDAVSCDLLESESEGPHIRGDIRDLDLSCYDMMIAFPPCTHLTVAGYRKDTWGGTEQQRALDFVRFLLAAPVPRIALENPQGAISTAIRKPDQYINPYQFGHIQQKRTGLWLKNLPRLVPTDIVPWERRREFVNTLSPSPERWRIRSRTFVGIARAMAEQWGQA